MNQNPENLKNVKNVKKEILCIYTKIKQYFIIKYESLTLEIDIKRIK